MLADSLTDLLARRATIHPERPAFVDAAGGPGLDHRGAWDATCRVAGALAVRGVRPGERVVVLADQTVDAWVFLHGAMRLGAVPVLLNWRLTVEELIPIAADARARLVATTPARAPLGAAVASGLGVEHVGTAAVDGADPLPDDVPFPGADDVAVQMYTSGTTALPKGVCTTHANVLALLDLLTAELPGYAADTRHLVAAPLFHIAGFGFGVGPLAVGAPAVLLERFDPAAVLDALEEHGITHTLLVPAMLQAVCAVPGAAERDTAALRGLLYGGSPMSVALMATVAATLGCPMTQAYGMTETTGIASLLRFDDHAAGLAAAGDDPARQRLASAGRAAIGTELRIDQPDATGAGEVLVRSPMTTPGYWDRPAENAATIEADGWLRTGDVGRLDADGFLFLVDRQKDMVITKGENVFPGEVERVLAEHPLVVDVAVVGIPDEEHGEALCAVVQVGPDGAPTLGDLQAFCRDRLAGFKLPRRLEVVDDLPRTPSGKVMRRVVREPFWADRDRQVN
ncbi:MAG: class I adenylate-forming enzyme family protein [Microthrixaceae bacterium]